MTPLDLDMQPGPILVLIWFALFVAMLIERHWRRRRK